MTTQEQNWVGRMYGEQHAEVVEGSGKDMINVLKQGLWEKK